MSVFFKCYKYTLILQFRRISMYTRNLPSDKEANKTMNKKLIILLLVAFFTYASQGCKASGHKDKTNKSNVEQKVKPASSSITQSAPDKAAVSTTNLAAFKSSPYKPSGLLLNLDFESERVKPAKKQKDTYDLLEMKLPGGQKTSVGIMYEGGDQKDRYAKIIADPTTKSGNHVFHYWLKNSRVPDQKKGKYKGRIQMNLTSVDKTTLFQRYRLYLHPDVALYRKYPSTNSWFGLTTMWMGARWQGHEYPFKIGVNIAKASGANQPLYFVVAGAVSDGGKVKRGKWKDVWGKVGANFEVPVGEWLNVEIGYKAGNKKNGRFYMAVKREKDDKFTTVIDVTDWTYHPDSPKPVPVTDWQPLKLYSTSKVFDFIRNKGGVAQMYWDDLEVYENW